MTFKAILPSPPHPIPPPTRALSRPLAPQRQKLADAPGAERGFGFRAYRGLGRIGNAGIYVYIYICIYTYIYIYMDCIGVGKGFGFRAGLGLGCSKVASMRV